MCSLCQKYAMHVAMYTKHATHTIFTCFVINNMDILTDQCILALLHSSNVYFLLLSNVFNQSPTLKPLFPILYYDK